MAWYGIDETWELCCNKGCLTKYAKHEVSLSDGRKKVIWLCPGCKYQDYYIMAKFVQLRERLDNMQGIPNKMKDIEEQIAQLKTMQLESLKGLEPEEYKKLVEKRDEYIEDLTNRIKELEKRVKFPKKRRSNNIKARIKSIKNVKQKVKNLKPKLKGIISRVKSRKKTSKHA